MLIHSENESTHTVHTLVYLDKEYYTKHINGGKSSKSKKLKAWDYRGRNNNTGNPWLTTTIEPNISIVKQYSC